MKDSTYSKILEYVVITLIVSLMATIMWSIDKRIEKDKVKSKQYETPKRID